jgi:hypothetical protein
MATGAGGRLIREYLGTDGVSLDGITSTTDTTLSFEAVEVPEGYQASFIMDIDAYATTDATFSVQYSHDNSNYHQLYWDEASAAAVQKALTVTTDLGAHILTFINPFVDNPNVTTSTKFRVQLITDGSNTDLTLGDCYFTVGPPVKGAVFETL